MDRMLSRIEAKELLLKDNQDKVAELRRQLERLETGEQCTGEGQIDTTDKDIAQLEREIAALGAVPQAATIYHLALWHLRAISMT
jgi:septal ring factor EnvC (AmiA/AmiB activator)